MPRRLRKLLILVVGLLAIAVLTLLSGLFGGFYEGGDGPGPGDRPGRAGEGVSGQVMSSTGRPAPSGIRVTMQGTRRRHVEMTDDAGRFRFETVPEGATTLEARLGPLKARVEIASHPVTIRLPGTCTLAGRVVTATTAEPVKTAVVRCAGRMVQTGARGIFRLDDVPVADARPPLLEVAAPNHVGLTFRPDLGCPSSAPRGCRAEPRRAHLPAGSRGSVGRPLPPDEAEVVRTPAGVYPEPSPPGLRAPRAP